MKLQIKPNELANYHSNHDHFYILLHKSKHTQMQIKMVNDHIIAQFRIKIYEKKTRVDGMHELKNRRISLFLILRITLIEKIIKP